MLVELMSSEKVSIILTKDTLITKTSTTKEKKFPILTIIVMILLTNLKLI